MSCPDDGPDWGKSNPRQAVISTATFTQWGNLSFLAAGPSSRWHAPGPGIFNVQRPHSLAHTFRPRAQVAKEDVDLICAEMCVADKKLAERRLKESGGDLAATLKSYM